MKFRNRIIAAMTAAALLAGNSAAFARQDPVKEKEPWDRTSWRQLVKSAFVDNNRELIWDWATMDMHDVVVGTDNVTVEIDETSIHPAHREILGIQNEFADIYTQVFGTDGKLNKSLTDAFARSMPMQTMRIGGTSSNYVNMATTLDEYSKRRGSEIVSFPEGGGSDGGGTLGRKAAGTYRMGLGEQLQMLFASNPGANLIPCISILTTDREDVKKIAHFLLDEVGESEWADKRYSIYGIKEPVEVAYWEMSNEIDQHTDLGREWYASAVRPVMEGILEVDPDAKILICGPSAPWTTGFAGNHEPKIEDWVEYITEQCGDLMYGMSWHPYYDGYGTAYMLWMSDDIKNHMDNVQEKMQFKDKDGNVKDFKIVGTEGARFDDPSDHNYPGSANYESALSTCHFLNVMSHREYYCGNMLHNMFTNVETMWPYYTRINNEFFCSPTTKLYELYYKALGDVILSSDWYITGENGEKGPYWSESCYEDWGFSANVYATNDDYVNVILLNKDNYREKEVDLQFKLGGYELQEITTLQAPNMFTYTWDRASEDLTTLTSQEMKEKDKYRFSIPNGTVLLLRYKDTAKRGIASGKGGTAAGGDDELSTDVSEVGFCDISDNWASGEIVQLNKLGFVSGRTPEEFAPAAAVTRAELAAMLTKALSLCTDYRGNVFADIPDGAWYEKYAGACYANGIITSENFNGGGSVTLREFLEMAETVYTSKKGMKNTDTSKILAANGIGGLSGSDADLVAAAINNGYFYRLYENGRFNLDGAVTRDMAASVIYRLYTKTM